MFLNFVLEAFFNMIHTPSSFPFAYFYDFNKVFEHKPTACKPSSYTHLTLPIDISYSLSLNDYISIIMLGRIYITVRLFNHYTYWTSARAMRVCKMNGFKADYRFALKAYLKLRPFTVLFSLLCIAVSIFAFAAK